MSRATVSISFVPEVLSFLTMWNMVLYETTRCQTGLDFLKWTTQSYKVNSRAGGCSRTSVPATECLRSANVAGSPARRDGNSST